MVNPDSTLTTLQIRLLGEFRVEVNGQPVNVRRKARHLIAVLALQPQHQMHREQLVELLWPGQEAEWAINNLHKTIHAARRALEPGVSAGGASGFITSREQRIILSAPGQLRIDVEEFERLAAAALKSSGSIEAGEAALALYGGQLLPEEPYEDWIIERRRELLSLQHKLLARLAALYEESGQVDKSIALYQQLAACDKLNEETHRQLMRLYALTGNRRQAFRQYESCREALHNEMGIMPEVETIKLYERIAAGEIQKSFAARAETRPPEAQSRGAAGTNLRHPLTSFIGRVEEINEISAQLINRRFVTLTGTGGIGKTRLALEVASRVRDKFEDGVWLVELASLKDPMLVERSVAAVLGVREEPGALLLQTLLHFLQTRRILLVVDNCEHVVEAVAALAVELLEASSGVSILATSREPIGVPGEMVWRVATLALPDPSVRPSAARLARCEAAQLFLERAKLSDPGWQLTDEGAADVAQLCCRLEGIPLALELAAAHIKALTVRQILSMLDDNFHLLANTERTIAPRHRTIRAAIDWSYELLSTDEQVLYRRLSVFAGGWSLGAAEAVCLTGSIETGSIIDLLVRLIDKSLVMVEHQKFEARYRFLETIRQYGLNKLRAADEEREVCARHLEWSLRLAEQAACAASGVEQHKRFTVLENEHDNLRAALQWSLHEERDVERGLKLCVALWRFWQSHGHISEGRRWFESALKLSGLSLSSLRADALHGASALASLQGDFEQARALLEDCLALRRESVDRRGEAHATQRLGIIAYYMGDYQQAGLLQERSLDICQQIGDQHGAARAIGGLGILALDQGDFEQAWSRFQECLSIYQLEDYKLGIVVTTNNLGETALRKGEMECARKLLEQSLKIAEELGDRGWVARSLHLLGHVHLARGLYAPAIESLTAALTILQEIGDAIIVHVLEGFACAVAAQGLAEPAVRLCEAAGALRRLTKMPRTPIEQASINRYLDKVLKNLDQNKLEQWRENGRAMTLDAAITYALQLQFQP